jgi:tetratricopeptide (TPR) repeat protein
MKTAMPVAATAVALSLLFGAPPSRAADKNAEWAACENTENAAGQIAACGALASDAAQTAEARAQAYYLRANAYGDKGEFDKAIADYGKAIELADYAIYYASRGWAFAQKGDAAQALRDCDKAIALNPNLALGYANRGAAYEKKGDLAKAIADYKAALAVKTDIEDELTGQDDAREALARLGQKPS